MIHQIIRESMVSHYSIVGKKMFQFMIERCNNSSFHFCHLNQELVTLTCDETGVRCNADETCHLFWFHEKIKTFIVSSRS